MISVLVEEMGQLIGQYKLRAGLNEAFEAGSPLPASSMAIIPALQA